jgi:hypothetical protein
VEYRVTITMQSKEQLMSTMDKESVEKLLKCLGNKRNRLFHITGDPGMTFRLDHVSSIFYEKV